MPGSSNSIAPPGWYRRYHLGDYVTLLHLPFASIVNAFVIIGAVMAPLVHIDRLILGAVGVQLILQAGHYYDETVGNPWDTRISDRNLLLIGTAFLAAGASIGLFLTW